ncbi:ZIP family metal transporter [Verticiella alkaliphila]|uniref:ZIP family metal transporter n=1 Tax=Verticiella alkaliphila TaxID=2779529 RepID=UPI0035301362
MLILMYQVWQALWQPDSVVMDALLGGLVAAGATALGAVPVLFSQRLSERTQDSLFGFGAGVMLAACAFSLVIPGIAAAQAQGAGQWGAPGIMAAAVLLGAALLLLLDRALPHEHFIKGLEGREAARLRRAWLFVFAIALHNLPEGLAIGVAFAGTTGPQASALTTGIAIQDVPEGLVVALALVSAGYSRVFSVVLAAATGLVEPLGAVLGATIIGVSEALLPWGLGIAAGAMLFVISHEIIPESHRKGHEVSATVGLMIGFVLMMMLDTALG